MTEATPRLELESANRLEFETLVAELSSRFVGIAPDAVDAQIKEAQRRVCEFLGLDLCALWQWETDRPGDFILTHLYRPLGGPPVPARMDASEYWPWSLQQVLAGKTVVLSSTEDAPEEAARDLEGWRHYGIKTTLTVPLATGGGPSFGAVSFNDMRAVRTWSELLVTRLQLVAQIFAMALARKRSDEMLRDSHQLLQRQLDFERLISDLTVKLSCASLSDVDRTIDLALQDLADFFGADRVTLFKLSSSGRHLHMVHVYACQSVELVAEVAPHEEFPWVWEQLRHGNPVAFSSLTELPEAAKKDRESFQRHGVQSHMSVPVIAGATARYVLAVGAVDREMPKLGTARSRMELLAHMLGGAISRKDLELARDENARFERVLASVSTHLGQALTGDIGQEIKAALREVLDFFDFDMVGIHEFSEDGSRLSTLFAAFADGAQPAPSASDRRRLYPWAYEKLLVGETLVMNATEIPEAAQRDREYCRSVGLRSFASIPLRNERGMRYVFSCLDTHGERDRWDKYVPRLRLLGETLVNSLSRKRAWADLEERAGFDRLLSNLSAELLNAAPERVDDVVGSALPGLLDVLDVQRCVIDQTVDSETDLEITHSVAVSGYEPLPKMRLSQLPWIHLEALAGRSVVLENLDQLPPEAEAERIYANSHGVTAIVHMPLNATDTALGAIAFFRARGIRRWDPNLLARMRRVADVFANAFLRKGAYEELAASELRFRTVSDFTCDWECWEGSDGKFLYVSPSCEKISGYDPEAFLADSTLLRRLIVPEDLSVWDGHVHPAPPGDRCGSLQIQIRTRSGEIRWIEHVCTPVRGPDDEYLGIRSSNRDITERKRVELALKESQWWLSHTQRIAHMGSWDWEVNTNRLKWSDETYHIFGLSPEGPEVTHDAFLEEVHPEDRDAVALAIQQVLDEPGRQFAIQHRIVRSDGSERIVHERGEVLRGEGGEPVRMIGSVQDVTERVLVESESRRLRVQLAHLDRVATASVMTGALAHEINQPLAAILSNAQAGLRLLNRGIDDLDDIRDLLRDIVHDDKRAGEVIRRLRTMLRKRGARTERVDLSVVVQGVADLLHSEVIIRGARLDVNLAPEPLFVCADSVQVQQVIVNLLLNGLQAVHGEPRIRRNVVLSTRADAGGRALVTVRDSGQGIPPDRLEHIFEPFQSTKEDGMGLGLAICRHIARAHGGSLVADNAPDGGARFVLSLPIERA